MYNKGKFHRPYQIHFKSSTKSEKIKENILWNPSSAKSIIIINYYNYFKIYYIKK